MLREDAQRIARCVPLLLPNRRRHVAPQHTKLTADRPRGAFGSLLLGLLYVWPSYTVALFKSENTTVLSAPMSLTEESLLGSLPSLGAMIGTALVGPVTETFGRKTGGVALFLPYVLSWAIIGITKSSIVILVARFMSGISGGASLVFSPMYISEVAEDSIRGLLASVPITFYGVGVLSSYMLGWFFSYNAIIYINLGITVLACLLLMGAAESPIYLLKKNREEDARKSLSVYRSASPKSMVVQDELTRLKQQINPTYELVAVNEKSEETEKEKLQAESKSLEPHKKASVLKTLFVSPASRRAFFVVLTVISMQVLMGIVPVQVYAKHVFTQADPSMADMYSVIFAVVMVGGSLTAGAIADKAGRRVLLITSSSLVALCMASLGFLLMLRSAPAWVTVVMILMYCFFFMLGAGSIPFVLLAEAFSPEVQAFASTLIVEWLWFLNFLILAVFTYLNSLIGIHGTFFVFAVNALVNAVLSFIIVPETKGLSNAQIQETFAKGRRK